MSVVAGDVRWLMGLLPEREKGGCASCGDKASMVCSRCKRPLCQTCDSKSAADASGRRGRDKSKEHVCLPCALEAGEIQGAALAVHKRMAEIDGLTGRRKGRSPSYKSEDILPLTHVGLVQLACLEACLPDRDLERFSDTLGTARTKFMGDIAQSYKFVSGRDSFKVEPLVDCLDLYYSELLDFLRGWPRWTAKDGASVEDFERALLALKFELKITKLHRYFGFHGLDDISRILGEITSTFSSRADAAFVEDDETGQVRLLRGVRRAYGRGMEHDDYEVSTFQGARAKVSKRQAAEEASTLLGGLVVATVWMGLAEAQSSLIPQMPSKVKGVIKGDVVRLGKAVVRSIRDAQAAGGVKVKRLEVVPKTVSVVIKQVRSAEESAQAGSLVESVALTINAIANVERLPVLYRSVLGEAPEEAHLMEAYDKWMALLLGQMHDNVDGLGKSSRDVEDASDLLSQLMGVVGELDGRFLRLLATLQADSDLDQETLVPVHRQFWGLVASLLRMDLLRHVDAGASRAIGEGALDQVEALADLKRRTGLAATPSTDIWLGDRFAPPRERGRLAPRPVQPPEPVEAQPLVRIIEEPKPAQVPATAEGTTTPWPPAPPPEGVGEGVPESPVVHPPPVTLLTPPAAPPPAAVPTDFGGPDVRDDAVQPAPPEEHVPAIPPPIGPPPEPRAAGVPTEAPTVREAAPTPETWPGAPQPEPGIAELPTEAPPVPIAPPTLETGPGAPPVEPSVTELPTEAPAVPEAPPIPETGPGALPPEPSITELPTEAPAVHEAPPPPVVETVDAQLVMEAMVRPPVLFLGMEPVIERGVGVFLPGTEGAFDALKDGLARSIRLSEDHLSDETVELPGFSAATQMRDAVRALVSAIAMELSGDDAGPLEVVAFVSIPDDGARDTALGIVSDPWIVAEERSVQAFIRGGSMGRGVVRAVHEALAPPGGPPVLLDTRGTYLSEWTWRLFRELCLLNAMAGGRRNLSLLQVAGNRAFLEKLSIGGGAEGLLRAMAQDAGVGE